MRSIKLIAFLIALLFILGFVIGCNDESSKTNLKSTETAGDDNGSVQDQGTKKSEESADNSKAAEKDADDEVDKNSDENTSKSNTSNSEDSAQDNPCQPIVDEADRQEAAGQKVDEEQLHKDLNECVSKNASVMGEVLTDETENASKSTGSGDDGEIEKGDGPSLCASGCWDRDCQFVNLDKPSCGYPDSAPVKATADQPSDSR